jgi:hypothetical protein
MYQTGYKGITALHTNLQFNGGFCKWYYTPRENISVWPAIDPATQFLSAEPSLFGGKSWYGPIKVPDKSLGFEEAQQKDKAGIFYKQKVSGVHPGDSASSRINLENMPYHEYVIVGKMRAGGLFLILGNTDHGLDFLESFKSSGKDAAVTEFSFAGESLNKGLILPAFLGENVISSGDGDDIIGGGDGDGNDIVINGQEIIFFYNVREVPIEWTNARRNNLGIFPTIQVWFMDEGTPHIADVNILVDVPPPNETLFTVQNSGPSSGWVILSR